MSPEVLTVSHSELATWARCPRRWYLGTYLGYGLDPATAPITSSAQLGIRIHLALEAHEGHGLDGLAVLDYIYSDLLIRYPFDEDVILKERDMAFAMLEGFLDWAAEEGYNTGYQVVATERETAVTLPFLDGNGSFSLIAKLDVLMQRLEDGAVFLRDYKTVGSFSKANGLARDTQMKTYAMIIALQAKEMPGIARADGGQYVMLLRSKRTPRATPPFYAVADFTYNSHDLNATWLRIRAIATQIRDARARLDAGQDHHAVAYPIPGEHCEWACNFSRICHMADDGSRFDDALRGNYLQIDPYQRYHDNPIEDVLQHFGKGTGKDASTPQETIR